MRKLKITISKEIVIADLIGFYACIKVYFLVVLNARNDVIKSLWLSLLLLLEIIFSERSFLSIIFVIIVIRVF